MTQISGRLPASTSQIGRPARLLSLWETALAYSSDLSFRFVVIVVIPTLIAAGYYTFMASPQYVSHTEYIVRGVDSHRSAGISALLNTFGISRAADETSAIESFLRSRDMVAKVNARMNLRAAYSTAAADWFARYPRPWQFDTNESLYTYMQGVVSVTQDPATSVTQLDVAAFDPATAKIVAQIMLSLAADMANNLNNLAQADTIGTAQREVSEAQENVVESQEELTEFRNRELMVDPLSFAGQMLQGIGKLSLDKSEIQTQIYESERLSPSNPAILALKAHEDALANKIADERSQLAGGTSALAGKLGAYDRLSLLRDLADKRYGSALLSFQSAQTDAQRKRVYVENIVEPNLSDEAALPGRFRMTLSVFVVTFMAFAILWILAVGSKDHAQ